MPSRWRNVLLEKLTDEVADDVLNNNMRQLSLDVIRSERDPMWFSSTDWACSVPKRRGDLQLSDDDLKRRVANRQGLTRQDWPPYKPTSIHAYNALQQSDPDKLPGFRDLVLSISRRQWPRNGRKPSHRACSINRSVPLFSPTDCRPGSGFPTCW